MLTSHLVLSNSKTTIEKLLVDLAEARTKLDEAIEALEQNRGAERHNPSNG